MSWVDESELLRAEARVEGAERAYDRLCEVNDTQAREMRRLELRISRLRVAIPAAGPQFPGRAHLRELPLTPEAWDALEDLLR